jgi:hypothetical protein
MHTSVAETRVGLRYSGAQVGLIGLCRCAHVTAELTDVCIKGLGTRLGWLVTQSVIGGASLCR